MPRGNFSCAIWLRIPKWPGREVSRLRDEMAETMSHHAEVTRHTFAVCEKTRQVAEAAATAAKELDDATSDGWWEVNTEKLAGRIQEELETALLRPLVAQCRQVEEMTPALKDAADQLEESARKLRSFHFKGILVVMLAACLVVMGACFSFRLVEAVPPLRPYGGRRPKANPVSQCEQPRSFHPADRDERPYPRATGY